VRHPGEQNALAEDWLFEAVTETYIPLLTLAEGWRRDRVHARLTLSLSPPLLEMLRDDLLAQRYVERLNVLLELAESEVRRNRGDDRFHDTAVMNRARLVDTLERFEKLYCRDLVAAFRFFQECGTFEIVTSCATHAFLPCFDTGYRRAQIRLGAKCYESHFDRRPTGMWLPECGFVPGIDRLLADEGIGFFVVDAHGFELADPTPVFATYSPIVCPSGVFAFPRDPESSAQVWSEASGYPGDARYREFYRDLGHELDDTSIAQLLLPDGSRRSLGLKYHRVTGADVALDDKQPYHRGHALQAANEHAAHFVRARAARSEHVRNLTLRPAVLVAPYDAELFGHWWFEGPEFLDFVVRRSAREQSEYRLSTATDVMDSGMEFQVAMPAASSWGAHGYNDTWLNDANDWIWPHLHRAAHELARIARERVGAQGLEARALNQLVRELTLASSSDWPFMITMGTTSAYGESRVQTHVNRFNRLVRDIEGGTIDEAWLAKIEAYDNIFQDLDYQGLGLG